MGYETGGYADKLGNRFEGRWIVRQMLLVIAGRLRTITLESVGDDERGVDLWIEANDGSREGQQCKGEHGTNSQWSMADLNRRGVLRHLRFQLERDGRHRFTFVSSVQARSLLDLSRRARDSTGDAFAFYEHQVKPPKDGKGSFYKDEFHAFCRYLELDPTKPSELETAHHLLSRSDCHQFASDAQDQQELETIAGFLVNGRPSVVISAVGSFPGPAQRPWARRNGTSRPGRLARRGSLVASWPMAPPCSSSFDPFPVSIGLREAVLRPLLTPASPAVDCSLAFPPFRQALLAGAMQVSSDKNVMFRCTSSPFT